MLRSGNILQHIGLVCFYVLYRARPEAQDALWCHGGGADMSMRNSLLSSTMLSGIAGGVLLAAVNANAADLRPIPPRKFNKAPPYAVHEWYQPAVDGFNANFNALGGSYMKRPLYGAGGSLSIPLGGQFGFQFDGIAGRYDNRGMGAVAGQFFFWRDPSRGLIGLYAAHTHWEVPAEFM